MGLELNNIVELKFSRSVARNKINSAKGIFAWNVFGYYDELHLYLRPTLSRFPPCWFDSQATLDKSLPKRYDPDHYSVFTRGTKIEPDELDLEERALVSVCSEDTNSKIKEIPTKTGLLAIIQLTLVKKLRSTETYTSIKALLSHFESKGFQSNLFGENTFCPTVSLEAGHFTMIVWSNNLHTIQKITNFLRYLSGSDVSMLEHEGSCFSNSITTLCIPNEQSFLDLLPKFPFAKPNFYYFNRFNVSPDADLSLNEAVSKLGLKYYSVFGFFDRLIEAKSPREIRKLIKSQELSDLKEKGGIRSSGLFLFAPQLPQPFSARLKRKRKINKQEAPQEKEQNAETKNTLYNNFLLGLDDNLKNLLKDAEILDEQKQKEIVDNTIARLGGTFLKEARSFSNYLFALRQSNDYIPGGEYFQKKATFFFDYLLQSIISQCKVSGLVSGDHLLKTNIDHEKLLHFLRALKSGLEERSASSLEVFGRKVVTHSNLNSPKIVGALNAGCDQFFEYLQNLQCVNDLKFINVVTSQPVMGAQWEPIIRDLYHKYIFSHTSIPTSSLNHFGQSMCMGFHEVHQNVIQYLFQIRSNTSYMMNRHKFELLFNLFTNFETETKPNIIETIPVLSPDKIRTLREIARNDIERSLYPESFSHAQNLLGIVNGLNSSSSQSWSACLTTYLDQHPKKGENDEELANSIFINLIGITSFLADPTRHYTITPNQLVDCIREFVFWEDFVEPRAYQHPAKADTLSDALHMAFDSPPFYDDGLGEHFSFFLKNKVLTLLNDEPINDEERNARKTHVDRVYKSIIDPDSVIRLKEEEELLSAAFILDILPPAPSPDEDLLEHLNLIADCSLSYHIVVSNREHAHDVKRNILRGFILAMVYYGFHNRDDKDSPPTELITPCSHSDYIQGLYNVVFPIFNKCASNIITSWQNALSSSEHEKSWAVCLGTAVGVYKTLLIDRRDVILRDLTGMVQRHRIALVTQHYTRHRQAIMKIGGDCHKTRQELHEICKTCSNILPGTDSEQTKQTVDKIFDLWSKQFK